MPKVFVGEPFCAVFQEVSGSEKVIGYEGDGRVSGFAVEFFFLTASKRFVGEFFIVSYTSGIEKC